MTEEYVVKEDGEWTVEQWSPTKVVLMSSDFTHDVALIVNGDFGCMSDKIRYAEEIARRLNLYNGGE